MFVLHKWSKFDLFVWRFSNLMSTIFFTSFWGAKADRHHHFRHFFWWLRTRGSREFPRGPLKRIASSGPRIVFNMLLKKHELLLYILKKKRMSLYYLLGWDKKLLYTSSAVRNVYDETFFYPFKISWPGKNEFFVYIILCMNERTYFERIKTEVLERFCRRRSTTWCLEDARFSRLY